MIRAIIVVLTVIIFSSCFGESYYEKGFYERISGMKFPQTAKAIESIDNGEFVTVTVFKVDSVELINFIKDYKLIPVTEKNGPHFFGDLYLTKDKPSMVDSGNRYYLSKK